MISNLDMRFTKTIDVESNQIFVVEQNINRLLETYSLLQQSSLLDPDNLQFENISLTEESRGVFSLFIYNS